MPACFLIYDGITIPIKSESIDFIYSVACLQHIPKPYVYNLFGEILRILKPSGSAALHFLAFSALKLWERFDLRREIGQQLLGAEVHWHHFYSAEELSYVLEHGYGAQRVKVVDTQDGSIWAAFTHGSDGGAVLVPSSARVDKLRTPDILTTADTPTSQQGDVLDSRFNELAAQVGQLEARLNRYCDVPPIRWARRLRSAVLGLPRPRQR